MGVTENSDKVAKKAAKAAAKVAKKQAQQVHPPASTPAGDPAPAERAAQAAERQVRLQQVRVVIALGSAVIALATLWFTIGHYGCTDSTTVPLGGLPAPATTQPAVASASD
ncbi:MAG: hypothetical protein KKB50_15100 [Planctomycetes bacterium]|nr:hypothetical protein [Planctomycetota bacterium]